MEEPPFIIYYSQVLREWITISISKLLCRSTINVIVCMESGKLAHLEFQKRINNIVLFAFIRHQNTQHIPIRREGANPHLIHVGAKFTANAILLFIGLRLPLW